MGFSFRKFGVRAEVRARFVLDIVSEDPAKPIALTLRHAGEGNPEYMSAALKSVNEAKGRAASNVVTISSIRASREDDVALFSKFVIVDWENVVEDGKPAPCTPDVIERFLSALSAPPPDGRPDVFDALRRFARDPENFRGPMTDAEDLGKG